MSAERHVRDGGPPGQNWTCKTCGRSSAECAGVRPNLTVDEQSQLCRKMPLRELREVMDRLGLRLVPAGGPDADPVRVVAYRMIGHGVHGLIQRSPEWPSVGVAS